VLRLRCDRTTPSITVIPIPGKSPRAMLSSNVALDVADRFYIIEKGHLVREATSAVLKDDPNLSAAYLSM
jgi:hypothetical protein